MTIKLPNCSLWELVPIPSRLRNREGVLNVPSQQYLDLCVSSRQCGFVLCQPSSDLGDGVIWGPLYAIFPAPFTE